MKRVSQLLPFLVLALAVLLPVCTDRKPIDPSNDPNTDISDLKYQPMLASVTYDQPIYEYSRTDTFVTPRDSTKIDTITIQAILYDTTYDCDTVSDTTDTVITCDTIPDSVIVWDTTFYDTVIMDTAIVDTGVVAYPQDFTDTTFSVVKAREDSVVLLWGGFTGGSITNDSLYKYYIYRGRSASTVFLRDSVSGTLNDSGTSVDVLPLTSYTDHDITADVTNDFVWYYQVSAGKLNGYEGAKSEVKSVTIPHTYYFRDYED